MTKTNGSITVPAAIDYVELCHRSIPVTDLIAIEDISNTLVIDSDESEAKAIDLVKRIKMYMVKVESARKETKAPYKQIVDRIDATFKSITDPLANCEQVIKEKLLVWMQRKIEIKLIEERRRQEEYQKQIEEAKIEKEAFGETDKMVDVPLAVIPSTQPSRGEIGTASQKSIWRWELTDISKVPQEYLTVNEKLVNEKVRSGVREIAGIRIYEEKTIAIR